MPKKTMGELLDEMRKNVEQQVFISTTTTLYKGRIKMVFEDFVEFEDRSKVQANLIYLPFNAIESFGAII
jgi:hypothetical protein